MTSSADVSSGWLGVERAVHKVDEDRIKDAKEDIDTLLVIVSAHVPHISPT